VTAPSPESLALSALGRALSAQDLSSAWRAAKDGLRETVARDPIDALVVTSLASAWLFYIAERDDNPQVRTFWDALVFVTTSLSVGYANVHAMTAAGKAIASALNTIGPAMTARALEAPRAEREARAQADQSAQREVIDAQRDLSARIEALVATIEAREARERPETSDPTKGIPQTSV
jgi:voltage-gated potassium channel